MSPETATEFVMVGLPVSDFVRDAPGDADVWVRVRAGRCTALMPVVAVEYMNDECHQNMLVVDLGADFETGHVAAAINPALTETVEDLNVLLIEARAS